MQSKVKDAVAIITGGSKGYGAGIAEVLKENGANVWITGRDRNTLESTADRLGVRCVAADVTSSADWDRVFEEVLGDAGLLRQGPDPTRTGSGLARSQGPGWRCCGRSP